MQRRDKQSKIHNRKTADANIRRGRKQSKVYTTEITLMPICRGEESKVKSTKLNYCRNQYAQTKKINSNIQKSNTADGNMPTRG